MIKIVVLGVDGLDLEFIKQWSNELPHLMSIQKQGIWGSLECIVPLTIPSAWVCTECGQNPGFHGVWDFTYRDEFSYNEVKVANPEITGRVDLLRTILPKKGQKVGIINVPVTWPPPKIPAGYAISGFIAPSPDHNFTYPDSLKEEVRKLVGDYITDVTKVDIGWGEGEVDKERLLRNIYKMDSQRFVLTKYLINEKNCDYVMTAIMGINRMFNLFYRCFDSKGERYNHDSCYENALHDYYIWIDKKIRKLRESFGKNVVLFIHSCYGSQKLNGRINLNEWLIKEGYMSILNYPMNLTSFKDVKVDWAKTKCWSIGYSGKLYLNMKGREPKGIIDPKDYDKLLDELTSKLKDIPDKAGAHLNTQVWIRDDLYFGPYTKFAPDLFVNFDEGRLGSSELVGHTQEKIYSFDNANYPDDVAHNLRGYFAVSGPCIPKEGEIKGISLRNVAPTVLDILGLPIPENMEGPSILSIVGKRVVTSKEEEIVSSRLEALGY